MRDSFDRVSAGFRGKLVANQELLSLRNIFAAKIICTAVGIFYNRRVRVNEFTFGPKYFRTENIFPPS
jgi:hypothetical protein